MTNCCTIEAPMEYTFAELLKSFRIRTGKSQQELANILRRGRTTVSNWERGQTLPEDREVVLHLGSGLGLKLEETDQLLTAAGYATNTSTPRETSTTQVLTAPIPDIRISVAPGFVTTAFGQALATFAITVQNHSPVIVALSGGIFIETRSGGIVVPNGDFITQEYQRFRELQPNRSFRLNVDPAEIKRQSYLGLICAATRDDVGRIYRSDVDEFTQAISNLFRHYMPR